MIKLFTLENLSAFSADTVYKICLSLEKFGLAEDSVYTFESYEEMYDAAISALQNGDRVLIAADTSDYNGVKKDLISKMPDSARFAVPPERRRPLQRLHLPGTCRNAQPAPARFQPR